MKAKWIIISLIVIAIMISVPCSFAQNLGSDVSVENNNTVPVNHYYFDSNVDSEGNGSVDSPYKYLSNETIKDNSVLHFANGDYNFTQLNTCKNVSFIGSDVSKTVIQVNGGMVCDEHVVLRNITFVNAQISVKGVFNASNTVFKDSTAKAGSYSNSYGGAIYAPKGSGGEVYVDNCTFINNTAQYGGAIYMYGGILDVKNSIFLNNYAYNYGGAITCEYNSKVKIRNSNFTKSYSINDAGGAVYLKCTNIEADNLVISDSSATFGAGLTLLFTDSTLSNISLFNNTAKYDGGAIYQVLGNITINKSNFTNNNANNGAGLYVGRCDNAVVNDCLFEDNQAISTARGFYSILNSNLSTNNLIYRSNYTYGNDFYDSQNVNPFISNGNYTFISNDYLYSNSNQYDSLPSQFLLNNIWIKDQQDGGNCWAFATLASLESCIFRASGQDILLSEENMKNVIALYSDYGWKMDTNYGGYDDMAIGYLVSWLGPVLISDDLYDGQSVLSPVLDSVTHVQNIIYLKRDNFTDNDAIKRAIINYGGVGTSIYMIGSYSQYYSGSSAANHAICIVGWDDTLQVGRAPGKGAWICKNSWGDWGYGGLFYVSYYDVSCAPVGYSDYTYVFIFNDTLKFDKNYQYDIPGKTDYFLNSSKTVWYKNIFTSTGNEYLAAVSTYFNQNTEWNVSVIVNNVLKSTKAGFSTPGYRTIELNDLVYLNPGDVFEVIFKIDVEKEAGVPISEVQSLVHQFYKENISYISYDGVNWTDFYDLKWEYPGHTYKSQVACIKAFTVLNPINTTLSFDISIDELDMVNVTAIVLNQYGKIVHGGKVIFNVNGVSYAVDVVEGVAKLSSELNIGLNNISAQYNAVGFITSSNSTTIHIPKLRERMELDISKDFGNVDLTVKLARPINETVIITILNNPYTLKSKSGTATLRLEDLPFGDYEVSVSLQSDTYDAQDINSSFTIAPFKTRIEANDSEAIFGYGNVVNVRLLDENSNALSNKTIIYTLNSIDYTKTTDKNGLIYIDDNLAVGNYILNIKFNGTKWYLNSNATSKITIKSSIDMPKSTIYTYNSTYKANFLDKSENGLSGNVAIIIDGVRHDVNAVNGVGSVNVLLNPGSYAVSVVNLLNNEVKNQTIRVVERIGGNNDLVTYYGSDDSFKVKVLDDNGNAAGNVQVTFTIGGKSYSGLTDSNGYAYLDIDENPNVYTVTASYKGFSVKNTVTVKSTVALPSNSVYTYNSVYKPSFLDASGNQLSGKVAYVVDGTRNEVNAADGLKITLNSGSHVVSVVNLVTGEVKNQTINVVDRIQENKDLVTYYGSGDSFKVKVLDDNGNAAGNVQVTFTIDGKSYSSLTDGNGYASLDINLPTNVYTLTASYKGFSVNNAITVKSTISLPTSNIYTYNSIYRASFLDKSGNKLSGNVAYILNGVRNEVNANDGVAVALNSGSYVVSVVNLVTGEVKNQTIRVVDRIQENNDLTTYYGSGEQYRVKVLDDNGNAAKNVGVTFTVGGKTYSRLTDGNGYAFLDIDLLANVYTVTASYKGFSVKNTVTVKSTVGLPSSTVYTYNSLYKPNFLDKSGNKFTGKVAIVLNGVRHEVNADDGVAVALNSGSYVVSVINLVTGEVKNQTINVVDRIQENKDLTTYYGSDNHFKVKVLDDNGNVARNVGVTFTVGGKTYSRLTDTNGYASLDIEMLPNVYTVTASYNGFSVKNTVTVKSTMGLPSSTVYTYNAVYKASFLDKSGNKLSGKVAYVLNGVRYEVNADNGVNVVLNPGSYVVSTANLVTGEVKNQTIRVVERIQENNDMVTYCNSGDLFKVKVLDDNGNAAKNVGVTFAVGGKTYSGLTDGNGYASLAISLLPNEYAITASYKGFSVKNKITVKSTVGLPSDTVYTYNSTYKPTFLDKSGNKLSGKATILINGAKYEINVNNGLNIVLNPGNYIASITNPVTGEVKNQTIRVVERIQDNNDMVTYCNSGDLFKVKVLDDNGNVAKNVGVTFAVGGKTYSGLTDGNGYASLAISLLPNVYTVTASYKGFSVKNKINVKSTIGLPSDAVYTYNSSYKASFLDKSGNKFTGKVAYVLNGVRYEVNEDNGLNVVLSPGSYIVSTINPVTGEAKDQTIKVVNRIQENNDLTVYYGSDEHFKVKVLDDNGNAAKNVEVTFTVGGKSYSSTTDNNGYAYFNVNVPSNVYTVTASYKGFSVKNKMTVKTTIGLPSNDTYIYNSTYKASFLDKTGNKLSGKVAYVLNGVRYEVNADEGISLVLDPNAYVVSVINLLTGEVKNQTINVIGKIAENKNLTTYYESGDSFKVKVLDDNMDAAKNVNVTFTINNQTYSTTTDDEGYASLDISLPPDVYNITTSYDGFSVTDVVTVKSTIDLPAGNVYTYSSVYKPNFKDKSGNKFIGKVAIILNNVRYEVNADEGIGVLLNPGSYPVSVVNLLTGEVKNETIHVVERITENEDMVTYYNSGESFKVKVLDDNGNAAKNVEVTFTANGKSYSARTDNNGYAYLNLDLTQKEYDIATSYKGFSVKNKIDVKSTIDLPNSTVYTYNSNYIAGFLDKSGNAFSGKVAYDIDGARYVVNSDEGLNLVLNPGSYVVSTINTVTGEVKNQTVKVVKRIQDNKDLTAYYGSDNHFKVKVLDDNGNVAKRVNVTFTVGGKSYSSLSDDNGYAYLDVNLAPDTYEVTASYKSFTVKNRITVKTTINLLLNKKDTYDSLYSIVLLDKSGNNLSGKVSITVDGIKNEVDANNGIAGIILNPGTHEVSVLNPVTGEVKNQIVNVISKIQENKDLTLYYGASKYYKVKILDYNGRIAKNAEVTFTINGKTYSKFTDSNGYASIKISNKLKPKTYTITTVYKDNNVSNKIKVKPTLILKDKTVKKSKTFKYTVKLLNNKGKILKNKYVKVKFKGKTYKAKTSSKGIATFKIKVNSKTGKYTITATYGSAKISKKITVKK